MSGEDEELELVWREECVLGAGAFGRVRLFVNKVHTKRANVQICMIEVIVIFIIYIHTEFTRVYTLARVDNKYILYCSKDKTIGMGNSSLYLLLVRVGCC